MAIQDYWTIDDASRRIKYTGAWTSGVPDNIHTVNALYTWLQDQFDEPERMDEPIPMSAQTPTEYTALFPWFIDDESMKALYEGAISTSGWKRVAATNNGIVQVKYSTVDPVGTDLGKPIVHETDSDAGVLVGFDTTRKMLWIRPDDETAANNFDSASGNLDVTGGTQDIVQTAASETGEAVWACIYTLGSIVAETEIYVVQVDDFTEVATPAYKKLAAWWHEDVDFSAAGGVDAGHVDLLVKVKELDALIDQGRLLVLARQYGKTYTHFELTCTGGRSAVPVSAGDDLDNTSGYRQFTTDAAAGSWGAGDVGTVIRRDGAGNERNKAIIASITGTSPNFTIQYFLIGDQTDFLDNNVVEDEAETKTMTLSANPTDVGPATETGIAATFGDTTGDIDEDETDERYSVTLDCNSKALSVVYERTKYLARRGETGDIGAGGQTLIGEWYRGVGEIFFTYSGEGASGPPQEGEAVQKNGDTSVTGIVTSVYDAGTTGYLILRQVRGTWADTDVCEAIAEANRNVTINSTPTSITPVSAAPFGTFAGGKFFFARGVKPINVPAADASNYQCIDTQGNVVDPPTKVTVQVTGLSAGDRAAIFEVTTLGGTVIKKDQHGLAAGNDEGDSDVVVDAAIPAETPGKSTGGVIRCVDVSASEEQRYRYSGWTASTFTLSTGISGSCTAGGDADTLLDTGASFLSADVEVGDVIKNTTDVEFAVVLAIVSDTELTTTPLPTGSWDNTDGYQSNRLDRAYNGAEDTAYVPIIDVVADAAAESNTLVYGADINVLARVRWSSGSGKILPFEQTGLKVESGGISVAAIRTADGIAS